MKIHNISFKFLCFSKIKITFEKAIIILEILRIIYICFLIIQWNLKKNITKFINSGSINKIIQPSLETCIMNNK